MAKRERGRSRLGYGAFAGSGEASLVAWDARRVFFEQMEDLAPEVLQTLRDEVLPHYRPPDAWTRDPVLPPDEHAQRAWQRFQELRSGTGERAAWDWALQPEEVQARLHAWASRFHLQEQWVLRAAMGTLAVWRLGVTEQVWLYPLPTPAPPALTADERRFVFAHPGWAPELLTRDQAEHNLRLGFETSLRSYLDGIARLARERGLRPTPAKRPRQGHDATRHFAWLVRWHVQGWTHAVIARAATVDVKTVAAGIRAAAAAAGLPRRSAPPQNPP